MIKIDTQLVSDAIVACETGGPAKEESARLIEFMLEKLPELPEWEWKVVATETPFYIKLAPKFYCIGIGDCHFMDAIGMIHAEWKTKGAPKLTREGKPYKGQDEESWLDDISNDVQVAVYALAAQQGIFLENEEEISFGVDAPRVMVRACVKSSPPEVWPRNHEDGLHTFSQVALDSTKNALLVKCKQIRAARESKLIPWNLVGGQCENKYRTICEFREEICKKHLNPLSRWGHKTESLEEMVEGRRKWYERLKVDPNDPEVVMLSPSKYTDYTWCMERGRQLYEGTEGAERESSFEQGIGTGYHAGLAAIYKQWPK